MKTIAENKGKKYNSKGEGNIHFHLSDLSVR